MIENVLTNIAQHYETGRTNYCQVFLMQREYCTSADGANAGAVVNAHGAASDTAVSVVTAVESS